MRHHWHLIYLYTSQTANTCSDYLRLLVVWALTFDMQGMICDLYNCISTLRFSLTRLESKSKFSNNHRPFFHTISCYILSQYVIECQTRCTGAFHLMAAPCSALIARHPILHTTLQRQTAVSNTIRESRAYGPVISPLSISFTFRNSTFRGFFAEYHELTPKIRHMRTPSGNRYIVYDDVYDMLVLFNSDKW